MRDPLADLIALLEPEANPDFWSDVGRWDAAELLACLKEEDWNRLAEECGRRPASWCIRLAGACVLCDDPLAVRPVVATLKRVEVDAGAAAASVLLDMNYQWSPDESLRPHVERHLCQANDAQAIPLKRLLGRLPS